MSMIRFSAFTPKDLETVRDWEAAGDNPGAELAEKYRVLVKDNFGKLMSTMIGEIARFFDITIKRKLDWESFYGWTFSYHNDFVCWYGISYRSDRFLHSCFGVKWDDAHSGTLQRLLDDEGYRKVVMPRDNAEWVVKEFPMEVFGIAGDEEQMTTFSKVAEDQLDLLEG
ncbi:MAG: hypothetical protein OEW11_09320 [Nitrospirota bacterium]|nr:hypothetical protein [Nitrospirota bacterium]